MTAHLFKPLHSRPTHQKLLHRSLLQEVRERDTNAEAEENAAVRFLAAVVGVDPNDPGEQSVARTITAADVRHVVRSAYRHGRSSRAR